MKLVINFSNTLMRRALGAVALVGVIAGAYFIGTARADGIPTGNAIFYAGVLEDTGVPVEGDRSLVIRLFDAPSGGAERCNTSVTATFTAGHFRVPLANPCVAAIHAYQDLFAEVSVGALTLPRTKLGAVPYAVEAERAMLAATADDADLLDGIDSVAFATAAHTHDAAALTSGTMSINRGGTGINTVSGNANRLLGANSAGTAYELKTLSPTTSQTTITNAAGAVTVGLAAGVPRACAYYSNSVATSTAATVTCPIGKFVVGGGGACSPSNDQGAGDENRMKYSRPDPTRDSWDVVCTAATKTTFAYAICCTE